MEKEEAMKILKDFRNKSALFSVRTALDTVFPELKENEDERIRKDIIVLVKDWWDRVNKDNISTKEQMITWLEKQGGKPQDKGEISDGYHTFNELYYYRMLYNAAFFNMLPKEWVHKSKKHHDGEDCFGGGWFIVMANLPTGQISNHYELKNWDLFQIPEKEVADKWDGHTPQEAADRLHKYLLEKQGENPQGKTSLEAAKEEKVDNQNCVKPVDKAEPKFKNGDWVVLSTSDGKKVVQIESIEYFPSGQPRYITSEGRWFGNGTKAHLWTIKDAEDGDVLACKIDGDSYILIYKQIKDGWIETYGHYYNAVDRFCVPSQMFCRDYQSALTPATKEQCDLLFNKMKEAGYEWDAEKKELEKIEQKPKWSEEDEELLQHCCGAVAAADYYTLEDKEEMENWLVSLKQRIGG